MPQNCKTLRPFQTSRNQLQILSGAVHYECLLFAINKRLGIDLLQVVADLQLSLNGL